MKRTVILILALAMVIIAGCSSRKTAMDAKEFADILAAEGFAVQEAASSSPLVDYYLAAIRDDFDVDFIVSPDNDSARLIFYQMKDSAEDQKGSTSSISESNFSARARYMQKSDGQYFAMSWIENTFIYVETTDANKSAVDEILNKLGY